MNACTLHTAQHIHEFRESWNREFVMRIKIGINVFYLINLREKLPFFIKVSAKKVKLRSVAALAY